MTMYVRGREEKHAKFKLRNMGRLKQGSVVLISVSLPLDTLLMSSNCIYFTKHRETRSFAVREQKMSLRAYTRLNYLGWTFL